MLTDFNTCLLSLLQGYLHGLVLHQESQHHGCQVKTSITQTKGGICLVGLGDNRPTVDQLGREEKMEFGGEKKSTVYHEAIHWKSFMNITHGIHLQIHG